MKKHLQKTFWMASLITFNVTGYAQTMVKDITAGTTGTSITSMTNVNGIVYFVVNSSTSPELWKSNGTDEGTVMVKDINPTGSDAVGNLINFKDTLFFTANDGVHGIELWKTDGTDAGTVMVKDIRTVMLQGDLSSSPTSLVVMNDTLYFSAYPAAYKQSIWKSDGTDAGTVSLKNFSGAAGKGPNNLFAIKNTLYFNADDGKTGRELWKTNGTVEGTVMVKDIFPGSYTTSSDPTLLTNVNDTLYFKAIGISLHANQIWKSDGTDAGTVMVKDVKVSSTSYITGLFGFDGALFFKYYEDLWKSNGTDAGTAQYKVFSKFNQPTVTNGSLYFFGDDVPSNFSYLWKMDNATAVPVKVSSYFTTILGPPVNVNGTFYFGADNNAMTAPDYIKAGMELWKSDGTIAGTVLHKDIFPGGAQYQSGNHSSPSNLLNVNGTLYFTATDADHGSELWKYEPVVTAIYSSVDNNKFSVYPNPSSGKFEINSQITHGEISIYNIVGERIFQSGISSLQSVIDISNQPAGIYFVKVSDGVKNYTRKLIVH